ncbi:MAG: hypothetical protein KGJ24_13785 [Burkholderiales bacterium]|nr:hypothetical protein [Burkholderiales bacterium]MDE2564269.1 hypothetical protein [Burkholderiales bacterium]
MSQARRRLDDRRDRLLRRSARLRAELGVELASWRRPLAAADLVQAGWGWLRANPQWPLAALALAAVARPRRLWRWLGVGLSAWRAGRSLTRLLGQRRRRR